jgi:hypothetical protein
MTYYQVEFQSDSSDRAPKRFRTEEKAKQHARKVLGISASSSLEARATILPVSRNRAPLA